LDSPFNSVVIDTEAIRVGDNWPERLDEALAQADVLILVIGRSWLTIPGKYGKRRLDHENDWVRNEIIHALRRKIPILPILISGAELPSKEGLPEDIHGLLNFNALTLNDASWDRDLAELLAALTHVGFGSTGPSAREFTNTESPSTCSKVRKPNAVPAKTPKLLEGNSVVLTIAAAAITATALFYEIYTPLAFGILPIVFCVLFVSKTRRTASIRATYPHVKIPRWLASRSIEDTAGVIAVSMFILTVVVIKLCEQIEWQLELGRLANMSVTFVLPSQDTSADPDRLRQYPKQIFETVRKDMVDVLNPLDDKIVVLPTANYQYPKLAAIFPARFANTELLTVMKQFRDERHRAPVKFAVHSTVSTANADFDIVIVSTEIIYLDWEKHRVERRAGLFNFADRRGDVRRLSLLTTYEVVNFFLQGRGEVDLRDKEAGNIRANLYTAFKDLHEIDRPAQERLDQSGGLQRVFECMQNCATEENLRFLAETYGKELIDEAGEARMKQEMSVLGARFKG